MLIMAYPRVDMFKPLRAFPDIYVNMADLVMDLLLAAIDQVEVRQYKPPPPLPLVSDNVPRAPMPPRLARPVNGSARA